MVWFPLDNHVISIDSDAVSFFLRTGIHAERRMRRDGIPAYVAVFR